MMKMTYEKELAYINKQLKKSRISLINAIDRNDKTAIENLQSTIEILENIKNYLESSSDKIIINCPMCGSMYETSKGHDCRKDELK